MIVENVSTVITACCILYNVCEVHGDQYNERWTEDNGDLAETTAATTGAASTVWNVLVQYHS